MTEGYVKYWRSSENSKLYFSEKFTKWQAWSDLLLLTQYKDNIVMVRGIPVSVKRGQVLAGEDFLARRWKWSRGKVRRFLQYLESETVQQIVQQKNNVVSLISIVNWEHYQGNGTIDGTPNSTANSTTDGQQTVQQTDTLKKDKKDKKVKNNNFTLPEWVNQESWGSFLEMRKQIKKPMTVRAMELAVGKLEKFKGDGYDPNAILDNAVFHNWQGLFVTDDMKPSLPEKKGELV